MGEVTDNHKSVFMFEFVKKLGELTFNKEHFSSTCTVGNLGWSILIERKTQEDDSDFEYVDSDWKGSLSVKVNCGGVSKLWCSYARIRLSLISQSEGGEDYSREFENLFSAMNPTWGYSEFIEWEKVIDPANGYVKDNVLKFQAHVVADIPQNSTADTSRDMPVEHEDWLALFEGNLNDQIVARISSEFIKMNSVIEKALTNEEMSEKIIGAAVNPIKDEIRSEIQSLEKRLEKFCANYIAKVVREVKHVKENVASGAATNNIFEGKSDYESKKSTNGDDVKKVHAAEEETVPVSVLKIMKELIVEQQKTSFGTWVPSMYGTRAAYYRTNEIRSYQPDAIRDTEEFVLPKGPVQPLIYDNNAESFDAYRQSEDVTANSEMGRGHDNQFSGSSQQQPRKNEKRKNDVYESKGEEMSAKISKPTVVPDETT